MILIHPCFEDYTERLFEYGIAQKGDGFKIMHTYKAPENKKFNEIAKIGGKLHNFLMENASCFYIDRLQGGIFYSHYDYDKDLVDYYQNLSNLDFLGMQVHESGNTRFLDWNRILRCLKEEGLSWNEENIHEAVKKHSANKDYPHFSQGPASEYAALTPPKTISEYMADQEFLLSRCQKQVWGNVVKCDAASMHFSTEAKHNIRTAFIEIGGQTPGTRIQFALRRGVSRSIGAKWGTYIEPWGGKETTAYRFTRDGANDWYDRRYNDPMEKWPELYNAVGENGGSSMSLAGRLMFTSLFSGADYFGEEHGAGNTFYDWKEGGLTPYGVYKKQMADLSRKLTNVKAEIPIAIILPKEYQMVQANCRNLPFTNDVVEGEYPDIVERITRLFSNGSKLGLEDRIYTTGRYGSLFDIIYENSYEHPDEEYQFIVDFSGKFADKLPNAVNAYQEDEMYAKLDAFVAEYLPFTYDASSDIDYMLFESNGDKYCCILNHNGVSKTLERGEWVVPEATVSFSLKLKHGKILEVLDLYNCGYDISDPTMLKTNLPGGDLILFRYG